MVELIQLAQRTEYLHTEEEHGHQRRQVQGAVADADGAPRERRCSTQGHAGVRNAAGADIERQDGHRGPVEVVGFPP